MCKSLLNSVLKSKTFYKAGSDTKIIFAAERLKRNLLVLTVDFRGVEIELKTVRRIEEF